MDKPKDDMANGPEKAGAPPDANAAPETPAPAPEVEIAAPSLETTGEETSVSIRVAYDDPWAVRVSHWLNGVRLLVMKRSPAQRELVKKHYRGYIPHVTVLDRTGSRSVTNPEKWTNRSFPQSLTRACSRSAVPATALSRPHRF